AAGAGGRADRLSVQAEDRIRDFRGTGVQTCALPVFACDLAEREGLTLVHRFDDPAVIAGQGTIGLELVEAAEFDSVLVPVGGGEIGRASCRGREESAAGGAWADKDASVGAYASMAST